MKPASWLFLAEMMAVFQVRTGVEKVPPAANGTVFELAKRAGRGTE